ncbi:methyltransferase domain-containing protein [Alcaligenaceae bacterium]|nr:methyltransferase domain-containing protein [Alcaligenaceae bacterium]
MPLKASTGESVNLRFSPVLSRPLELASRFLNFTLTHAANLPWVAERVSFLQAWRANPRSIGAIWPSSARLAAAITREANPLDGPCLELGAGTGSFTRALVAQGFLPRNLVLIETCERFAHQLRDEFPGAQVHEISATKLAQLRLFPDERAGVAICGLPLLNMSARHQVDILQGVFSHLRPGGFMLLFTYGPNCPVPRRLLDRLGLRARRTETVIANLPPAHIWKISRRFSRRADPYAEGI